MLNPTRVLRASWTSTLKLPKSTFPARPLASEQSKYIKRCSDDLYAWQAAERPAQNPFVLHDGPPYANGSLHIGHALNKILKDIICRFQLSQGKRVHYRPGWDCHGLPIEIKAVQQHAEVADGGYNALDPVRLREDARTIAVRAIQEQKQGFKDWAVMGAWDDAYTTMEKDFELRQLRIFKTMVEKGEVGLSRRGHSMHSSPQASRCDSN